MQSVLITARAHTCTCRISELGRGTYGTVLLAENKDASASPRRVAVKLCRGKENEMGLMLKEGMAMQRLNSPMIARLVEMGCAANRGQGIVYTVLELLQGKSVNELVTQRGPLPIAEACRVGINVLDGLRDVHNSGFIHRDIKPHNIIRVEVGGLSLSCSRCLSAQEARAAPSLAGSASLGSASGHRELCLKGRVGRRRPIFPHRRGDWGRRGWRSSHSSPTHSLTHSKTY